MKITVIEVDSDDHSAAIAAITAALGHNGVSTSAAKADVKPRARRVHSTRVKAIAAAPHVEDVEEVSLSAVLATTWEWLVAHDIKKGVRAADIAEGLGVNVHTVTWRMNQLMNKGLAHRPRRGYYRAGEKL